MSGLTRSINAAQLDLDQKKVFQAVLASLQTVRDSVGGVLAASATLNVASLNDGAGATSTISVPGAQLGDFAFASMGVSLVGVTAAAYVSAVDVVSVRFQNESGSTVDLASTTLKVFVIPQETKTKLWGILEASATLDVGSLNDAVGETDTITVTGAALGDFVYVSHGVDLQGVLLTGYVSVADTVAVRFQNETAGTVDLGSTTLRVHVIPKALGSALTALGGCFFGSVTYDPPNLIDAAGTTTTVSVLGAQIGDFPIVSLGVDLQGITVTSYVSAADVVSVRLQNESGGTLNLASTTLRAMVLKATPTSVAPALTLAA